MNPATSAVPRVPPEVSGRLCAHVRASSGRTRDTVSPLDASPLAAVPQSTPQDVADAFARARVAQRAWVATDPDTRAPVLLRFHDLLLAHRDELMDLICSESGKARKDAFEEVTHLALTARYYGRTLVGHLASERRLGLFPGLTRIDVHHHAKGVVAVISPWNYPLTMAYCDGVAALAAGNAVVCKPDAQTMLVALRALELLREAGLPGELWQVVAGPGQELGPALVGGADHVCFTGSTDTGRLIGRQTGERLIGASLELGGKNPGVVCADADLERAAEGLVRGCFSNAGQLCVAVERLYVDSTVYEAFRAVFLRRVAALDLSVGAGWGPDVGTLASPDQLEKVSRHVEDARAKGARVLAGGRPRPDLAPWAYEPTVLERVDATMECFAGETFGPVVSLYPFATEEDAVALANAGPEGLNASVWSRDEARARELARRIRCGTVNVNEALAAALGSIDAPMGGMGDSGLGRRQGREGILRFTETQTVATQRVMGLGGLPGLSQEQFAVLTTTAFGLFRRTPRP